MSAQVGAVRTTSGTNTMKRPGRVSSGPFRVRPDTVNDVIEIVTLRLRPDADEAAFDAVDSRLQVEFFYLQPGLQRRTTARSDDGMWAIVTSWDSEADADAAFATLPSADGSVEWLGLIDRGSLVRRRFHER